MILTAACAATGGALAWWHWRGPWLGTLAILLGGLLVLALVLPRAYAPVSAVLDRAVHLLLQGITWLLLGVVFVLVFIPGRLLLALRGVDPLARDGFTTGTTAWHEARRPREIGRYFRAQY